MLQCQHECQARIYVANYILLFTLSCFQDGRLSTNSANHAQIPTKYRAELLLSVSDAAKVAKYALCVVVEGVRVMF